MEKHYRKLSTNGEYSLKIPLPPGWLRSHNLVKGDTVEIICADDGSVRIYPVKKEKDGGAEK
ncbi:MAG: AbrB/MazE/SpoVT family DNA-binding domain-containing protein [Candidatus Micrarchaeia archaeon]